MGIIQNTIGKAFNKVSEKLPNEFIDVIDWAEEGSDTIVWKFPRYQNEIKNGAQLTVRPTQLAVLVNEGEFGDIYQAGRHELVTANMPITTSLKSWKYKLNSPFKVDVFFASTKQFINLKWGTKNPIMMRDPEFGAIRMRAFGTYCFRINSQDPTKFIKNVAGMRDKFTINDVQEQLRNFMITKFTDHLAESKIAALDMAANLSEFSSALENVLQSDFDELGIELTKFLVENISLPENVEKALDERTSMGIVGDMNKYTQFEFAQALKTGAANPSGGSSATDAMGMGMGFAMAQQMAQQMAAQNQAASQQAGAAVPPPIPRAAMYYVALNGQQTGPFAAAQLQQMAASGQLTKDSLVWCQGMTEWSAAGTLKDLSGLFGAVPPPIPR